MGFRMAKNLRSKMPTDADLIVSEIVKPVLEKFVAETKGQRIKVANSPNEVAEQSVRDYIRIPLQ